MMKRLIPILALALCLGAFSETLAERIAELGSASGVAQAREVPGTRQAHPIFTDWETVRVSYVHVDTASGIATMNTIELLIDPEGQAWYSGRRPSPVQVREAPPRVGGDADIVSAVEAVAGAAVQKPQIMHGVDSAGAPYADVTGYVESSGRLARREYHVRADERGALVVKAYDAQAATEPVSR